jgi:hypothetical protein
MEMNNHQNVAVSPALANTQPETKAARPVAAPRSSTSQKAMATTCKAGQGCPGWGQRLSQALAGVSQSACATPNGQANAKP